MAPRGVRASYVDVTAALGEGASGKTVSLDLMLEMVHGEEAVP